MHRVAPIIIEIKQMDKIIYFYYQVKKLIKELYGDILQ
jgi:hypothetical protein